jgi:hypothetical protein
MDMKNRQRSLIAEFTALRTQEIAAAAADGGDGGDVRTEDRDEIIQKIFMASKCPMCRTPGPTTAQESFILLKSCVSKHDDWAWAHHTLGRFYEDGMGCEVDMNQAISHFSTAAVIGHTYSQHCLANCYASGRGATKPCLKQATWWYKQAANEGFAPSQYSLGAIYHQRDRSQEAATLFGLAAEQGVDVAQCALARCYAHGIGVEQSWEKSLYWYKQAADQGNSDGMAKYARNLMKIARIRQKGNVTELDQSPVPEALCWAEKAVTAGNTKAKKLIRQIKLLAIKHKVCIQCQKPAGEGKRLTICGSCYAVPYCGRVCQISHWIAGHKRDCSNLIGRKKRRRIWET